MNDKYSMVADIIEGEKITDTRIKDAIRVAYFRGLSHCDSRKEIIDREIISSVNLSDMQRNS